MKRRIFLCGVGLLVLLNLNVLNVFATSPTSKSSSAKVKYIFYFIGDGMGISQTSAAEAYLGALEGKGGIKQLELNKLPYQGFYTTYAENRFITGSAAAGTALSSGIKTTINTIGMHGDKVTPVETIAEKARNKGMKVGIISSVSLDHATPAAFYAHQASRNMYYKISLDLSKSGFNYFAGGGLKHPEGDGKINDKNSMANMGLGNGDVKGGQTNAFAVAKARDYNVIKTYSEFKQLQPGADKILAISEELQGGASLPYAIDQVNEDFTLQALTQKGIDLLDNPKGFFMMIEGGKIDWACHANDAATVINEVIQFDNAVATAMEFYKKHPDETLIVVGGDHETGGLALGFAGSHYDSAFELLKHQNISYEAFTAKINKYRSTHATNASFDDVFALVKKHFGLGNGEKEMALSDFEMKQLKDAFKYSMMAPKERKKDDQYYLLFGSYDPVTVTACHIMAQKAGIGWTTYSHTAVPLPVRAIGPGSEAFTGFFDNTDLPKKIMEISGIK
ncbi:alkaline phosphatase [Puteibacter caeruleilacunae]|nr:alkaline phosphatase [Puteibacter caeruleilacunae]